MKYTTTLLVAAFSLTVSLSASAITQKKDSTLYYHSQFLKEEGKSLLYEGEIKKGATVLLEALELSKQGNLKGVKEEILEIISDIHYNKDTLKGTIFAKQWRSGIYLSRCGNYIATSDSLKNVYVYDIAARKMFKEPFAPFYKDSYVKSVIMDIGNGIIVILYNDHICVWDSNTMKLSNIIKTTSYVKNLDLSSDGKQLAILTDKYISIMDLENKNETFRYYSKFIVSHKIKFVDNDKRIAIIDGRRIKLFDIEGNCEIKTEIPEDFTTDYTSYDFNFRSDKILLGNCNTVGILDAHTGEFRILEFLRGESYPGFVGNGEKIFTYKPFEGIGIWDLEGERLLMRKKFNTNAYIFALNDRILLTNNGNTIKASEGIPDKWDMIHDNNILDVKISPNSKLIATSGFDSTARVWDNTGRPVSPIIRVEKQGVREINFSPCNNYLLTRYENKGKNINGDLKNRIQVWEISTGKEVPTGIVQRGAINSASFSPCGKYIITASNDMDVKIWDFKKGVLAMKPLKHNSKVNYAEYSHDGKYIASASNDRSVKLWNAQSGEIIHSPLKHDGVAIKAIFSPDNNLVASIDNKGKIYLWSVGSGKLIATQEWHTNRIIEIIFSSDSKKLATSSTDTTFGVWSTEDLSPVFEPVKLKNFPDGLGFLNNDSLLAVCCWDGNIGIYNANTGEKQLHKISHTRRAHELAVAPNGEYFVTGSLDRTAKIRKLKDIRSITEDFGKNREKLSYADSVYYCLKGDFIENYIKSKYYIHLAKHALLKKDTLAALEIMKSFLPDTPQKEREDYCNEMVDLYRDILMQSEGKPQMIDLPEITEIILSKCNRYIVATTKDSSIHILDANTLKVLHSRKESVKIQLLQLGNDGKSFITINDNDEIKVWNLGSLRQIGKTIIHEGVNKAVLSHDGKRVVSSSMEIAIEDNAGSVGSNSVKVWNLKNGKAIADICKDEFAYTLNISKDDKYLILYNGKYLKVYELKKRNKALYSIEKGKYGIHPIVLSPCGKYMTYKKDNYIHLQEISSGKDIIDPIKCKFSIKNIEFSPCGTFFAVNLQNENNSIRFYNATTGEEIFAPIYKRSHSNSINYSPNGKYLFVEGYGKNQNRFYDIETGKIVSGDFNRALNKGNMFYSPWKIQIYNNSRKALITNGHYGEKDALIWDFEKCYMNLE